MPTTPVGIFLWAGYPSSAMQIEFRRRPETYLGEVRYTKPMREGALFLEHITTNGLCLMLPEKLLEIVV